MLGGRRSSHRGGGPVAVREGHGFRDRRGRSGVNGSITSAQRHFRTTVSSYYWLAFDGAADQALFASHVRCDDCLPGKVEVRRLIVLGRSGRVATLAGSDSHRCHLGDYGSAATLGPGADAVTVAWSHGRLAVIGYDGTVRRRLDVTAALARGADVTSLAWSPDGAASLC